MTRCLVTGGSGFVGVNLVRRLLDDGLEVRVLDRVPLAAPDLSDRIEFVQGDVCDRAVVDRAVAGCDWIFHTAAMVPLTRAGDEFVEVNVRGTENVAESALQAGVKHFVHLSSSAIYGIPESFPVREDTTSVPLGAYGRSKQAGEQAVMAARERGLPAAIIRPRTIIGPGRLGIFDLLFDWIRGGTPIFLLGRADQPFQLLSNRDLAEAMLAACHKGAVGDYNVGADRYTSLREDLNEMASRLDSRSRVVGVPAWIARPGLMLLDWLRLSPLVDWHYKTIDKPYWFDNDRPHRELGYAPIDSNVEMLVQAYEWHRANRETVAGQGRSAHRSRLSRGVLRLLSLGRG